MYKKINLLNKHFGQLIVLRESCNRTKDGRVMWLCKCQCGKEKEISSRSLINGEANSCGSGHYMSEVRTTMYGGITKDYWNTIISGAKKRGIQFSIEPNDAWALLEKQKHRCALSGRNISLPSKIKGRHMANRGRRSTASLDRIDSKGGYTIDNIQWVHKYIQFMKHIQNNEDFIQMCSEVCGWQNIKDKVICISGGMDLLHVGHIRMIQAAAEMGKVVVILNSDEWLMRKKGFMFMPWLERKELLMGIRGVHDVVDVNDSDDTVCEALIRIRPNYFGNGGDRTDDNTPERQVCDEMGITMLYGLGGAKIQSSSTLVKNAVKIIDGLSG